MAFPVLGSPKPQFFDSSGSPLSSGTIEFRDPATDSLIDTYPTADDADAATNANDNPLTLNSRGEPGSGLFGPEDEVYKITLKDSAGSTIWTADKVRLLSANVALLDTINAFTASQFIDTTDAFLGFGDTSATADQGRFFIRSIGDGITMSLQNDAKSTSTAFFRLERTGNTADSIALTATSVTVNGAAVLTADPVSAVTDLNQTISGSYVQAEVQAISDKVDELLAAMRTGNVLAT